MRHRVNQAWNLGLIRWRFDGTVNCPVSHTKHTRPRRCPSWAGRVTEKGTPPPKKKKHNSSISCDAPAEEVWWNLFQVEQLGNEVSILPCGALCEHEPCSTSVFILFHKSTRIQFISANSWKIRDSSEPIVPRNLILHDPSCQTSPSVSIFSIKSVLKRIISSDCSHLRPTDENTGQREALSDLPRCVSQHCCHIYFTRSLWREGKTRYKESFWKNV